MSKKEKKQKEAAPVGRPTKYDPKYCQMILDYFGEAPYKEVMKKVITKTGDVVEVPQVEATDFKSLAGFACLIGTHRETLLNWMKEHADFFDAFKRAKDLQESFMIINGNKGLLQPAFAIFTAKNVMDWRDKKEITHDGRISNLTDEQVDKLLEEKLKAKK